MSGMLTRLGDFVKVARFILLQTIQRNIISIRRSRFFSPATQPNAWKVLKAKTYLYPSRIFRPKIENATLKPLVIMVHGGGFIMNNPSVDDPLARYLADSCDCIVVSIDYRKSPRSMFPEAYEDVVESIVALLGDDGSDLQIDRDKVILCGSSAGGNLVLGAAQDSRLRGKVLGIAGIYPAVNLSATAEEQMARRPDPNAPDFIGTMWNDLRDFYIGTTNVATLQDPRLSPTYFKKRVDLPKNIIMTGCEHDMLCYEAKSMAERLADVPDLQQEQNADSWSRNNVTWKLIRGQPHAFDHFARNPGVEEETRVRERELMYQDIAQWLRDVFGAV